MTIAAHGDAMLEPEDRPGHPSIHPMPRRSRPGVYLYEEDSLRSGRLQHTRWRLWPDDAACSVSALDMTVFYSKHFSPVAACSALLFAFAEAS